MVWLGVVCAGKPGEAGQEAVGQRLGSGLVAEAVEHLACLANIRELANHTGAREFHTSARRTVPANPADGLFQTERFETDALVALP